MRSTDKREGLHWSLVAGLTALLILTMLLGRSCLRREDTDDGLPADETSEAAVARTGRTSGGDEGGVGAGARGLGSVPPMVVATPGDGPVAESGPSDPLGKRASSSLIYEAAGKSGAAP